VKKHIIWSVVFSSEGLVNYSMDCNRGHVSSAEVDIERLSATVCELSKARRFVSSYPQGHPLIIQSCTKVAELFAQLFDVRDEVSMGVSRDALWVDTGSLELRAPAARGLAGKLFYYGVALIRFRKGITVGEIEKCVRILLEKRSEIVAQGGLERVFVAAGIEHVNVSMIEYDAFRPSDDFVEESSGQNLSRSSLWEVFVQKLLVNTGISLPSVALPPAKVTSETLADAVNGQSSEILVGVIDSLEDCVSSKTYQGGIVGDSEFFDKVADFIGRLSLELRVRFFEVAATHVQGQEDILMEIFSRMPVSAMLEIREYFLKSGTAMSPYIQDVLASLVNDSMPAPDATRADILETGDGKEADGCLLREEDVEYFVPSDYLDTLKKLIASQEFPEPESVQLEMLLRSLSSENIGLSVSRIICVTLGNASVGQLEMFTSTLLELLRHFLLSGDFCSLGSMYDSLVTLQFKPGHPAIPLKKEVLAEFGTNSFIEDVLDGLDIWGKPKFTDIGDLIQKIGEPFIEPLLERLGDVESITIRRYYLSQLTLLARLAKKAVLARLGDSRWYFLRNLLTILQHAGDPSVVSDLSRVACFSNPKVRYKVIETYLLFQSPEGDRLLLRDLKATEHEVRLQAIQLAEKSVACEVFESLLDIVRGKRLSATDVLEKKAAVRSLARIGNKGALPVLESVLKARCFFRRSHHKAIKKEIVATLGLYRDTLAIELLQKIKKSSDIELSALALVSYRAAVGEN
jgi:hypothetical protein